MMCPNCNEECIPYLVDESFTHEFGIHRPPVYFACNICDSPLPNFVPGEREGYLWMDR
jgi:transcription initiation factor IIE alpha subunit